MTQALGFYDDSASQWEKALYAFLIEKERRSGSRRTVDGYSGMLRHFFGSAGKTPDRVTGQDVFVWAHGPSAGRGHRDEGRGSIPGGLRRLLQLSRKGGKTGRV